jgi:hypothetical protein
MQRCEESSFYSRGNNLYWQTPSSGFFSIKDEDKLASKIMELIIRAIYPKIYFISLCSILKII